MTRALVWTLVLVSATSGFAATASAQQAPEAAQAPTSASAGVAPAASAPPLADSAPTAASSPTAASAPTARDISNLPTVSASTLKKARDAGYHMKVRHNAVVFCKLVTETGTRFTNEICMDENQLAQVLMRQQAQRDQIATNHSCVGMSCNGR